MRGNLRREKKLTKKYLRATFETSRNRALFDSEKVFPIPFKNFE